MTTAKEKINQTEFAKLAGVGRAYISKLVGKGIITVGEDGLIDAQEGLRQFEERKDYRREPQRDWAKKQREQAQGGSSAGDLSADKDLKVGDIECSDSHIGRETQRSRLFSETFKGLLSKIEYQEKIGELIRVEDSKKANRKIASILRSELLLLDSSIVNEVDVILGGLSAKEKLKIEKAVKKTINKLLKIFVSLGGEDDPAGA